MDEGPPWWRSLCNLLLSGAIRAVLADEEKPLGRAAESCDRRIFMIQVKQ
jgi:hypothetical protein